MTTKQSVGANVAEREVLVDTPVWSLSLRREPTNLNAREADSVDRLRNLTSANLAQMIGPVRQELLSGLREDAQFFRLRDLLHGFLDVRLFTEDYEEAARMSNVCRHHGVAGSSTDFLVCAVASRRRWQIFTTDRDFDRYRHLLSVKLFSA
jgi:predicted nucleic acid-binding protein